MGIPLGEETELLVEESPNCDGLDLVFTGPNVYVAIKLEPTHIAALIAILKAELPGVMSEAEHTRRFDFASKVDASTRNILMDDEEYIAKEPKSRRK